MAGLKEWFKQDWVDIGSKKKDKNKKNKQIRMMAKKGSPDPKAKFIAAANKKKKKKII